MNIQAGDNAFHGATVTENSQTIEQMHGGNAAVHQTIHYGQQIDPSVWYEQVIIGLEAEVRQGEIDDAARERLKAEAKEYEAEIKKFQPNKALLWRFIKKLPSQPWRITKILQAGLPIPPPASTLLGFAVEAGKEYESEAAAREIEARFRVLEQRLLEEERNA